MAGLFTLILVVLTCVPDRCNLSVESQDLLNELGLCIVSTLSQINIASRCTLCRRALYIVAASCRCRVSRHLHGGLSHQVSPFGAESHWHLLLLLSSSIVCIMIELDLLWLVFFLLAIENLPTWLLFLMLLLLLLLGI